LGYDRIMGVSQTYWHFILEVCGTDIVSDIGTWAKLGYPCFRDQINSHAKIGFSYQCTHQTECTL